ncbi:ras-related protein ORAB-1-like [Haliotis rufescens]|uniref:ras-related protein ORAB-1-like n=1 Tax=Haliotis rufescens TaxID=6454 RepID=UPI00201F5642|nr:ras-related protein ORAB-1-like [Haliotis rufescens]
MDAPQTLMLSNQVTVMSKTDEARPGRLKLVLLGNQHVGKTSLLQRYVNNVYNPAYTHTRGGDIFKKEMMVDGRRIKLKFMDTAGQPDIKSLIRSLYRDANGIMVVFDVTNEHSFEMVEGWIDRVTKDIEPKPQLMMVGNKHDLTAHRTIEMDQANARAGSFCAPYYDVSAKTGGNVKEAFETFIRKTWRNLQPNSNREMSSSIRLEETSEDGGRICCGS